MEIKLETAKEILENEDITLVVYTDGTYLKYKEHGIKRIVDLLKQDKDFLKDTIIADKVIGKAAASILSVAGVKEIYAQTISEAAVCVLEKYKIPYSYNCVVPYIQNRDKSGMCPMEEKCMNEPSINKIYESFVNGL